MTILELTMQRMLKEGNSNNKAQYFVILFDVPWYSLKAIATVITIVTILP